MKDQGAERSETSALVAELEGHILDLETQLQLAALTNEETAHALGNARTELASKSTELSELVSSYDDVAKFMLRCMEEVREKIVTVVREERPGSRETAGGPQRGDTADIAVLPGGWRCGCGWLCMCMCVFGGGVDCAQGSCCAVALVVVLRVLW